MGKKQPQTGQITIPFNDMVCNTLKLCNPKDLKYFATPQDIIIDRFEPFDDDQMDAMYVAITNAFEKAAQTAMEEIDVDATLKKTEYIDNWHFVLTPKKDWENSAHKVLELVNCSGYTGTYETIKELKRVTDSKTNTDLVKSHLGWATTANECFGNRPDIKRNFNKDASNW